MIRLRISTRGGLVASGLGAAAYRGDRVGRRRSRTRVFPRALVREVDLRRGQRLGHVRNAVLPPLRAGIGLRDRVPLTSGLPGDVDAIVSRQGAFLVAIAIALVTRVCFCLDVLVAASVDPLGRAPALLRLLV